MSLEQKRKLCQVIKNAKLPQGYASNLSRYVQVGERKIVGYKSYDAHFMMNYLLPIAVKTTLPKDVASPLIRLCAFFKDQFKLGGPVSSRCMYGIERNLHEMKQDVQNKARLEGSMAEGYKAKECVAFIARFLKRSSKAISKVNECGTSKSLFLKMKRNRPKVSASQSQLTEYELQRLQKLKFNAEKMEALESTSVANKILEAKTKALICPSAMQNSTPENENDDSTSENDGENEVETDNIMEAGNLTFGKRKASFKASK
uniref:DUF4218 domain-containing protein n=1 Tax=Chenopodium quinoa TaxID=63459 RepID=A0A803N5B0_CHEQI